MGTPSGLGGHNKQNSLARPVLRMDIMPYLEPSSIHNTKMNKVFIGLVPGNKILVVSGLDINNLSFP